FLAGCDAMARGAALGGFAEAAQRGGAARDWQAVCAAAHAVPPGDEAAARHFFETAFQPYGISADGSAAGLFTGYYEPEVAGARQPGGIYRYPIYRRPPGLPAGPGHRPYFTRAQIDAGALRGRHLELFWLADPIDAFFLHIQGAARIRLPDGQVVRVSYDGQNGRTYVPIGRVLVDRGQMTLDQVSMQSIRAWLVAHPSEAQGLMEQNPSYVFFRELRGVPADEGPPSALGAPLSPRRSLAVDKSFVPLGAPVWVDTTDPTGAPLRRLAVAQDLGGAIRGPVRADIFFGWGPAAEEAAGRMHQQGHDFVLLPRRPGDALAAR
ncbi:MAG: MltA domain-containing protein, partial [Rhodospirillales bacterium]|nr:MltA domain-containing protein [Rhodospirillales bacterium]